MIMMLYKIFRFEKVQIKRKIVLFFLALLIYLAILLGSSQFVVQQWKYSAQMDGGFHPSSYFHKLWRILSNWGTDRTGHGFLLFELIVFSRFLIF